MKRSDPAAMVDEATARKAEKPVRGRNVRMDAFLRNVSGDARFGVTAIEARLRKPPRNGKTDP
ncbi:MAG: hypothetical protein WCK28_06180 [Burkholderiales bacterium]|jgi:hypothetical protein